MALRTALIVGHPGHELRVFGWATQNRPMVHVLTDGSGVSGLSRVVSTERLIATLGCEPGEVFAPLSDAELYATLLSRRPEPFLGVLDALAASLTAHHIGLVAGDAWEGFNPTHDICRALIDAAAATASRRLGSKIENLSFTLTEHEVPVSPNTEAPKQSLILDNTMFARKIAAAYAYGFDVRDEVQLARERMGDDFFRAERLCEDKPIKVPKGWMPYYEIRGRERVAQGKYKSALTYAAHVAPVIAAIAAHAESHGAVAATAAFRNQARP